MRRLLPLIALAFVACSSSGSGGGTDGGSNSACRALVTEMCQKAVACSSGSAVVFIVGADADSGINAFDFTVNGAQSQCEGLVGTACGATHQASFTANCADASAYQCGPSSSHGNGLEVPAVCWNSL